MNKGKICVSVCAETADELFEQIKRAEDLADVIEIRFDCLKINEEQKALQNLLKLKSKKVYLATFRQSEQGGKRKLLSQDHINFWQTSKIDSIMQWSDFEFDLYTEKFNLIFENNIRSFHLFNRTLLKHKPDFLAEFYEKLKIEFPESIYKIAVQTNDITDSIPVWKLLEKAKSEKREIIQIAMGESGKWTRILGLANGAFMTYAALDDGKETAPGQVSARDLIEVYRVKELNEETEIYGILGSNTSVSMSPYIHNTAFKFHNLNAVFVPLQVHDLDEFIKRMVKPETREIELNFKGFSVTIPHKQAIIKHLDFIDETAEKIGAVNTVKIIDGKLHGFNTDAKGFIEPLLNAYGDLKNVKVAILGAGGAARACIYALQKESAKVTVFARNLEKAKSLAEDFNCEISNFKSKDENYSEFDVLVNTTPLGMKGKADDETPALAAQLKDLHLVYDLIYIPFQTTLMIEADKAEVPKIGGLAMLIAQAIGQQKIWTGLDAPMKEMSRAVLERLG